MNAPLHTLRTRWVVIALAVAAVAFVAGVNYGLRTTEDIVAQEPTPPNITFPTPTDAEWDALASQTPTGGELIVVFEPEEGGAKSMSKARAEYMASNRSKTIYLWNIDKTVHLPDHVYIEDIVQGIECFGGGDPQNPDDKGLFPKCPSLPLHILKNGDAVIGLDASGRVFDYSIDGDTIKHFSFLKGYEVVNLIWD